MDDNSVWSSLIKIRKVKDEKDLIVKLNFQILLEQPLETNDDYQELYAFVTEKATTIKAYMDQNVDAYIDATVDMTSIEYVMSTVDIEKTVIACCDIIKDITSGRRITRTIIVKNIDPSVKMFWNMVHGVLKRQKYPCMDYVFLK